MLRNLATDMRATHEEHLLAMENYYRYRAIMTVTPSFALGDEVDEAVILKDVFENAISFGDPGEFLTKKTRVLLYTLALLLEIAFFAASLAIFDRILPSGWNVPVAIITTVAFAIIFDNLFFRWIYNPIGKIALKRRINRLNFWSAVAKNSIVA